MCYNAVKICHFGLRKLKGYILSKTLSLGKASVMCLTTQMYSNVNRQCQAGLKEALIQGHGTVLREFYRVSPLYKIYGSIVNIRQTHWFPLRFLRYGEKRNITAQENIWPVHGTQFLQ